MARRCDITGKGVLSGNNVSHAHNKTRRRYLPNIQTISVLSVALDSSVRLRLSTSAIRSIEHSGGLDTYLLDAADKNLAPEGLRLKKRIKKALASKAA